MDQTTVANRRSLLKGLAALTMTAGAAPVVAAVANVHNSAAALVKGHKAAVVARDAALAEVQRLEPVFKAARERELFAAMPGIGHCQPWLVSRGEVWANYAADRLRLERKGLNCDALRAEAVANWDASMQAEEAIAERVGLNAAETAHSDAWERADELLIELLAMPAVNAAEGEAKAVYLAQVHHLEGRQWEGRHILALIRSSQVEA